MNQLELKLKNEGMSLAASANREWLERARQIARTLTSAHGEVTIDDVRARWIYSIPFGNWAGSVFKGGEFVCVGYQETEHKGSHGRIIKVWTLRDSHNSNSNAV